MKRLSFMCLSILVLSIFMVYSANASLVNNGNNFFYDDDLNMTWYAIANSNNLSASEANSWAANLNVGGVSGWRLPIVSVPDAGYGCGSGERSAWTEMGHLFYSEGLMSGDGPFQSFERTAPYISGTLFQGNPWLFSFSDGYQWPDDGQQYFHALAVHDGNVVATTQTPIPPSAWLLGSGLIGLLGLRRGFKKYLNK